MTVRNVLLSIALACNSSAIRAEFVIASASTHVTNINMQVVGGAIVYPPGLGPTYIHYGPTAADVTTVFSSNNTFAAATALLAIGGSTFEGKVAVDEIFSVATASASDSGVFASIFGDSITGSQTSANLYIQPYTQVLLSFDVVASTDISGAMPGYGAAIAGLRAHLGGQYIDIVSCKSSYLYGCTGLEGVASSAHVVWTVSSESSPLSTILYFNSSAYAAGISAVPETKSAYMLLVGVLAIFGKWHRREVGKGDA